jgi:hypothetical protein
VWKLYTKFRTDSLKQKVKQLDAERTAAEQAFVMNREETLVSEGNIGSFFKCVDNKITNKTGLGQIKDTGGTSIHGDMKEAELFNDFFSSAFTKDDKNVLTITSIRLVRTVLLIYVSLWRI